MSNHPGQARPGDEGPAPAWVTIVDWPGGRLETFDAFEASHDDRDEHTGLRARYCTQLPDALRIVAIWDSEEVADRFFASLPSANKARLAPKGPPARSSFPAHRAYAAAT